MNSRNSRWCRRLAWFYAVVSGGILATSISTRAELKALLVGVAKYPALENNPQIPKLRGPENDVELLAHVLEHHGFHRRSIRILSTAKDQAVPTRANILGELQSLATEAQSQDQIVIYLSGHGSQQPAEDSPDNRESDGLDEVFLPSDAQRWSPAMRRIPGAISDNEFGILLRQICSKGAFVWFIADTCHSGTLTRGVPGVARQIPAVELVPADQMPSPNTVIETVGPALRSNARGFGVAIDSIPQLIEMYACRPGETTRELPLSGVRGQYNGLFTYQLAQALQSLPRGSTYSDLMEQIRLSYAALGITSFSPMLLGEQRRRRVLGADTQNAIEPFTVQSREGRLFVTGGRLAGLQPGTLLRTKSPTAPGTKNPSIDLIVTEPQLFDAEVNAIDSGPIRSLNPIRVAPGTACEVVSNTAPDLRLHLFVSPNVPRRSLRSLQQSPDWTARIEIVESRETADWVLEEDPSAGQHAYVLRSSWKQMDPTVPRSLLPTEAATTQLSMNPNGEWDAPSHSQLHNSLPHIARAVTFLKALSIPSIHGVGTNPFPFELGIRQLAHPTDPTGRPAPDSPGGIMLSDKDIVQLTLTNRSGNPLQVALFCVSSVFEIKNLPLSDPIIAPDGSVAMDPYEVTTEDGASLQIVAIAQRGNGEMGPDLAVFEQPALAKSSQQAVRGADSEKSLRLFTSASGTTKAMRSGIRSPLDFWMETDHGGTVRSKSPGGVPSYGIQVLNLRIVQSDSSPQKAPKP